MWYLGSNSSIPRECFVLSLLGLRTLVVDFIFSASVDVSPAVVIVDAPKLLIVTEGFLSFVWSDVIGTDLTSLAIVAYCPALAILLGKVVLLDILTDLSKLRFGDQPTFGCGNKEK